VLEFNTKEAFAQVNTLIIRGNWEILINCILNSIEQLSQITKHSFDHNGGQFD